MRYDYENMEMLVPFVKESVGESNLPDRTLTMEKTDGEIAEDNLDWEKKKLIWMRHWILQTVLDGYEIEVK